MKLTIEIPDDIATDLETAIQKFNAREQAEKDAGRHASLLPVSATDFLLREVKGCLGNFILTEHRRDLEGQAETLVEEEKAKINKALQK